MAETPKPYTAEGLLSIERELATGALAGALARSTFRRLLVTAKAQLQRIRDLEALHEAKAEMERSCFGPEVADQNGYEKAEKRFNKLHDKLWPPKPDTGTASIQLPPGGQND